MFLDQHPFQSTNYYCSVSLRAAFEASTTFISTCHFPLNTNVAAGPTKDDPGTHPTWQNDGHPRANIACQSLFSRNRTQDWTDVCCTSLCTGWCRSSWFGRVCWVPSCCEPQIFCRSWRTCQGSRLWSPSGYLDGGSPPGRHTSTAYPPTSGGRTRPWCTPGKKTTDRAQSKLHANQSDLLLTERFIRVVL